MTHEDRTSDPKLLGHEPIGTNVRAVWLTGAGLAAVVVVALLVVSGLMRFLYAEDSAIHGPAAQQPPLPAGVPELNSDQSAERRKLQEREENVLSSFGWIDREKEIARVPIADAMQVVATGGLPVFPPAPTAPSAPDSSSSAESEPPMPEGSSSP